MGKAASLQQQRKTPRSRGQEAAQQAREASALNIAVFAVDPGGATGLAWGIFDPTAEIGACLRGRMDAGSDTVTGDIPEQIRAIAQAWQKFFRQAVDVNRLPVSHVWLVVENFRFTGANYAGDSAVISTALIWGVEGYRMGTADEWKSRRGGRRAAMPQMILQEAGQASAAARNAWLKEWGVWVVGREHERSAWKHIAYFLKRYQIQHQLT
jgi:hypothetical protein